MNRRIKLYIILSLLLFVVSNCQLVSDECKGKPTRQDAPIPATEKNQIFHFNTPTRWLFRSNAGNVDTALVGVPFSTYKEGSCTQKDCCTRTWIEQLSMPLDFISKDNLEKYTAVTMLTEGGWNVGNTTFSLGFGTADTTSKVSLTIDSKVLSDIYVRYQSYNTLAPYTTYWSLSYGLVRYDYIQASDTIIYERTDL